MKATDNRNATKANATIDNVYTIHIEDFPSKPTTISMRKKV